MTRAGIHDLWVLHRLKAAGLAAGSADPPADMAALVDHGVFLDTCLRQLAFGLGLAPRLEAAERLAGVDAYGFLLEVATGLRSAVPGETNVLGQFRQACQEGVSRHPAGPRLAPLTRTLLADARAIRAAHLQGIGGASYGSLVRRLLAPARGARVLFVGAGELARSMLPFFDAFTVGMWNHREVKPVEDVPAWFSPDEQAAAAAWAEHLIFTTPADDAHDRAWDEHLGAAPPGLRSLVHLGRRREQAMTWRNHFIALDLDHVFALSRSQQSLRAHRLARARLACAAQARLRTATAHPAPVRLAFA